MIEITRFKQWYRTSGHWIYPSMRTAAVIWINNGINGLEDAPEHTTLAMVVGEDA